MPGETYQGIVTRESGVTPLPVTLHQQFRSLKTKGMIIILLSTDSASRCRRPARWFLLILFWESINILLTQTVEILFTFSHSIGKFRHARCMEVRTKNYLHMSERRACSLVKRMVVRSKK